LSAVVLHRSMHFDGGSDAPKSAHRMPPSMADAARCMLDACSMRFPTEPTMMHRRTEKISRVRATEKWWWKGRSSQSVVFLSSPCPFQLGNSAAQPSSTSQQGQNSLEIFLSRAVSKVWKEGNDSFKFLWSLRQKLDSPRQADRRLGQSNAQKRLFDRPGLSTFWRIDHRRNTVF